MNTMKKKFREDKKFRIAVFCGAGVCVICLALIVWVASVKSKEKEAYNALVAGYDYVFTEEEFDAYLESGVIRYPEGEDTTLMGEK